MHFPLHLIEAVINVSDSSSDNELISSPFSPSSSHTTEPSASSSPSSTLPDLPRRQDDHGTIVFYCQPCLTMVDSVVAMVSDHGL